MTNLPTCEHCGEKPVRVVELVTGEKLIGQVCDDCVSEICKSDLPFAEKMQLMMLMTAPLPTVSNPKQ